LVEVDFDAVEFPVAPFFWDVLPGVGFELFEEDAVFGDFGFGLSVGGAGDADAYGAGGAVAGEADDADVEGEVFSAELCADADFAGGL